MPPLEKVFLIIDESGAKGYSDKGETYPGEIGVMAGFLVLEKNIKNVRVDLDSIKAKYLSDGKVHITDMPPDKQENLRQEIFSYIIDNNLACVFEAIHNEGFFRYFESINKICAEANKQRQSNIKISNNEAKELLHEQLFQGAFGKGIALCIDNFGNTFHLSVITDNIDEGIKRRFSVSANELLDFGDKKVRIVTGYDPCNKTVVRGDITTELGNIKDIIDDYSKIRFSIDCEDTGLTLAADVIANSLNYHFKNRIATELGSPLNTKNALKDFPLQSVMYGLWESQDLNYCSDAFFMYPEDSEKK